MNNRMDGQNPMLLDKLTNYAGTDHYPFHMPGHKRREELGITSFPNPFSVDITEIDGFDNLHHAEGMLKDSISRASLRAASSPISETNVGLSWASSLPEVLPSVAVSAVTSKMSSIT